MIQFNKPTNLNGSELLAELNAAGVAITQAPFDDAEGSIWLEITENDKTKATAIVKAHNGTTIAPVPTIADKLASVGLSVDELKAALGV
jgi:hypothetical protein